jgi:hypothetical protein
MKQRLHTIAAWLYAQFVTAKTASLKKTIVGLTPIRESDIRSKAMDNLAEEMDQVMARLQRAGMAHCAPKLNPKGDPAKWLSDKQAPWKKLANEKPKGETIAYDTLLNAWKNGKVR